MPQNSRLNAQKKTAAAFCAGRRHDFQLFRESGIKLPPHVVLLADAGYQGVAEIHPNSQTPFKKTILSERYRNRKKRFGLRFSLIAAVYNMELKIACG